MYTTHLRGYMVWLLAHYSKTYANNQYRVFQQFWSWWSAEEDQPNPMVGMKPPKPSTRVPPGLTPEEMGRLIGDAESGRDGSNGRWTRTGSWRPMRGRSASPTR